MCIGPSSPTLHVVHFTRGKRRDTIGMNLAKIRTARGLSQKALGEMIGMDAATIQRAETMHRSAKLTTYVACADALGVTLADLFSEGLSPVERRIIDAFRGMSEQQRDRTAELLGLLSAPREASA